MLEDQHSKKQSVELPNTMHPPPQSFVMISKAYSVGISLRKDGPQITKEFSSECILDSGKTFRTAVTFIPKLFAKHFVTTLTVADELTYYESIAFERRTVMQNFSETINIFFPKDKTNNYCSSLYFDPNATTRCFLAGIELLPAQKFVVREELNDGDATECVEKIVINGDIIGCQQMLNNGGI